MGNVAPVGTFDDDRHPQHAQLDDTLRRGPAHTPERAREVADREAGKQALAEQEQGLAALAEEQARCEAAHVASGSLPLEHHRAIKQTTAERELLQAALLAELAEALAAERIAAATEPGQEACTPTGEEQLRGTLATELDALRAALAQEQLASGEARASRDELQAVIERERLEMSRALTRQHQLERKGAELQTALERVQLRNDEWSATLGVAARQAALIDVILERARRKGSGKGKRGRALDDVTIAQEQLARLRSTLSALAGSSTLPEPAGATAPVYDPHRILPGLRAPGVPAPVLANGASSNGHHHEHPARLPLIGNGRAGALHLAPPFTPVDIIVCVHNALDDVQRCLDSVVRHTPASCRLIIIDDASETPTALYLRRFVHEHPRATLLRNDRAVGYTKAANQGLRAATSEVMVLLNSDTIVTARWLEHLLACLHSDPQIGIVGPLSNAASYQSVPERFDPGGDWALNPAPPGWDIDAVAAAVARISTRAFPRVPFVNGFCLAVTRAVIEAIGGFDEAGFPDGYGEENDFCLRAADAGFALAIADQAYVYHAKSRSYTHERRRALGKAGRATLVGKYGLPRLQAGEARLRDEPRLAAMRSALAAAFQAAQPGLSVLFLLPVGGGGGGAHSVVQEARGIRRLGINAQVAIRALHLDRYRENYPALYEREELFFAYDAPGELQAHAAHFSVVVATIYSSIPLLAEIAAGHPTLLPAYYIQDYEPFFYPEGSAGREDAARSYTRIPHALLFAKTRWLCDTVGALHNVTVHKVSPSLDHDVYFPAPEPRRAGPVRVVAMIRPSSPRRGAGRTMQVLRRLTADLGQQVDVNIFGCSDAALAAAGLPRDFPFVNHGVLTREEVAATLRASDIFLDLSDYQAFGRTGLEAMACGCAVVLPALGGTSEYAVHGENALVVDTSNPDICFQAAHALATHHDARQRLQAAGIATAAEYSIDRAATSEIKLLAREWQALQQQPLTNRNGRYGMLSSKIVA